MHRLERVCLITHSGSGSSMIFTNSVATYYEVLEARVGDVLDLQIRRKWP